MPARYQPLVSIAIPTYNRADSYLRGTIESALGQTYPHLEILIADNASTDHTRELVTEFDDERIRYVRHVENLGPFRNFQFCLDNAQGELLYILHDDDRADSDFVETCVNAFAKLPDAGFVRTGLRTIDQEGQVIQEFPNRTVGLQGDAYVHAWLQRRTYWYFSSTLIRTEALQSLDGPFSKYRHTSDCANFARLAFRYKGVDIREIKASCRLHDQKLTRAATVSRWIDEYERVRDELVESAGDDWKNKIREGANDLFSEICYRHAGRISKLANRYATYARIYQTFDQSRIPPPLSRLSQQVLPDTLVRWGQQLRQSIMLSKDPTT